MGAFLHFLVVFWALWDLIGRLLCDLFVSLLQGSGGEGADAEKVSCLWMLVCVIMLSIFPVVITNLEPLARM